ncbi:protein rolling stone-like [Branchiostoma floridae x Branchiostoma japonicum]
MTCGQRMRSEFRLKSFGLTYNDLHVFTRTPWLSNQNQLPFLLYRVAVCLYHVVIYVGLRGALGGFQPLNLIYLTDWAYISLTLHTALNALLCLADYFNSRSQRGATSDESSDDVMDTGPTISPTTTGSNAAAQESIGQDSNQPLPIPWFYKLSWVLYNVAFSEGIHITILFWALIGGDSSDVSILMHAMNSVTIVIDVMVSGFPCRLLHFVYPLTFGAVYILFTVVYWAAGGRGEDNLPFIYPYLDYGGNPVLAVIVAVLSVVVAMPLCHCVVFALALARESLVRLLQRCPPGDSQNVNVTGSVDAGLENHANSTCRSGSLTSIECTAL